MATRDLSIDAPPRRNAQETQILRGVGIQSVDEEARTFEIILATDRELSRRTWYGERFVEQLDLSDGAMRLGRLKAGRCPLLESHGQWSTENTRGEITEPRFENLTGEDGQSFRALICKVRVPVVPEIEEVEKSWLRVVHGLVKNISVAYDVHTWEVIAVEGDDPQPTRYIAREWEPLEGSYVAVGADAESYIRAQEGRDPNMAGRNNQGTDPTPAPARTTPTPPPPADDPRAQGVQAENQRQADIREIARKFAGHELDEGIVARALADPSVTADAFRAQMVDALAAKRAGTPAPGAANPAEAGAGADPAGAASRSPEELRAEGRRAECERQEGIRAVARKFPGIDATLETRALGDATVTVDAFRSRVLDALAERQATGGGGDPTPGAPRDTGGGAQVQVTEDATDKRRAGMVAAMLWRGGNRAALQKYLKLTDDELDPGEFRSFGMFALARECCEVAGFRTRGLDDRTTAAIALNMREYTQNLRASVVGSMQTTSDFPVILQDVIHKQMQVGYAMMPHTYPRWTKPVNAQDFRPHYVYRASALSQLDRLGEAAQIEYKDLPDGERGTFRLDTYANIIAITRQVMVNDDLGVLMDLAEKLGQSHQLTKEEKAFELLRMNGGKGPSVEVQRKSGKTSNTLFHTSHANVGGATRITPNAINADCLRMSEQKDPGGNEFLGIMPRIMLVSNYLHNVSSLINRSEYNVWDVIDGTVQGATTARVAGRVPNVAQNKFDDIIHTPRLNGTSNAAPRYSRYYFADPMMYPVFCFSYLHGVEEPMIDNFVDYNRDGRSLRIITDFGISVTDFRGAYHNPGTMHG